MHKGKILWRGHPSSRKLDEDINALIAGEEVSFDEPKNDSEPASEEPASHVEEAEIQEKLTAAHGLLAGLQEA